VSRTLKSWAIYRYEGSGKLQYLGVISATGQDENGQWLK
jgi:hypothetical protein